MLEGVIHVDDSSRVVLRGAVVDPGPGAIVSSCDWHAARSSACRVDAAFFDWGTSAGPFDSNSVDRACGSVMVAPWTFDGAEHESSMPPWSISNCDRSIADPPRGHYICVGKLQFRASCAAKFVRTRPRVCECLRYRHHASGLSIRRSKDCTSGLDLSHFFGCGGYRGVRSGPGG